MNLDGVLLRKSSKTNIWPIHIAINELPSSIRYRLENMIVGDMWQAKKKGVPMYQYVTLFAEHIKKLANGFEVNTGTGLISLPFNVILGTFDLPAKSKILNMTQFNGAFGCSSCEEPGAKEKQGRGSVQVYPYQVIKPKLREATNIICHKAPNSNDKKRIKGIKGYSGLLGLSQLDIVKGIVPDYMHGVLLGAMKTLFSLWFCGKNSKEEFLLVNI